MSTPLGKVPVAQVPASQAIKGTPPPMNTMIGGKDKNKKKAKAEKPAADAPGTTKTQTLITALGRRPDDVDDALYDRKHKRAFFLAMAASVIAFIVWMNIGTLDIVSMTMGEVIPSTQVKTIQHLEGGIVLEIHVREGQKVKQGQMLVVLEKTNTGADVAELTIRLDALSIDITRLEAEGVGATALDYGEETVSRHPDLVIQAMERFRIRKRTQDSKLASHKQLVQQRQNEIEEIQARIARFRQALKLQSEQITISEDLLKDQLTNRYLHLDLLKKANELKGGVREDGAALNRAKAALQETHDNLETAKSEFLESVRNELDAARLERSELTERMKKFQDTLRRTSLRAPVDGVIKTVYVATIGGVIKAGDPVVDIVPGEDRLVIESQLPTQDIGYVAVGQEVVVKLTSADAARFGSLDGVVSAISPDTHLSPEGAPYYKVRIETDKSYFGKGGLRYQLYPGMQLSTNIRTGERTVFEYVFDPMTKGMSDALQER